MNPGSELLLRGSIWLALAAGLVAIYRQDPCDQARAWRWGACAYLIHVAAAFHLRHDWSHAQALAATARQTATVTGWNSGSGLWANYAFSIGWGLVAVRWTRLSQWPRRIWIAAFLFMALNGAVIFVPSPTRWLGVGMLTGLGLAMVTRHHRMPPRGK